MKETELEEMRNQINILKEKLDKQSIINNTLLKKSMKTKVNTIHSQGWKSVACGLLSIVIFTFLHFAIGLSLTFVTCTIVLMLFCIWGTWYSHLPLREHDFMGQDVRTTILAFSTVKRRYKLWLYYITPPTCILWVLWCCHEYVKTLNMPETHAKYFYALIIISCIIGMAVGYSWYRKVVNTCDEAITQIEETE